MPDADAWRRLVDQLREDAGGVLVPVRAHPRARRAGVVGLHAGCLKVATTVAPEAGRATAAIGRELATALGLSASRVACVSGGTGRDKVYRVEGLDRAEVRRRLGEVLT